MGMRGLASLLKLFTLLGKITHKTLSSSDKIIEVKSVGITEGEDIDDAIMEKVFSVFQSDLMKFMALVAPKFQHPYQLFFFFIGNKLKKIGLLLW